MIPNARPGGRKGAAQRVTPPRAHPPKEGASARTTTVPAQKKPCDFANPGCAPGEKCQLWGGGLPKYGDYNGTACAAGHVYATWASATPPAGSVEVLPNPGKIGIFI